MAQIDGIKAMLSDILGAKQVIKFAYRYTCTSNHGQDCSFSQDLMTIFVFCHAKCTIRAWILFYIISTYCEDIYVWLLPYPKKEK